jgi:hypothetical protein
MTAPSLAAMSEPSQWQLTANCRTGRRCSTALPIRFPGRDHGLSSQTGLDQRGDDLSVSGFCLLPDKRVDGRFADTTAGEQPRKLMSFNTHGVKDRTVSRTGRCRGSDGRVDTDAVGSSPDQEPPRGGALHNLTAAADEKDISAAMISGFNDLGVQRGATTGLSSSSRGRQCTVPARPMSAIADCRNAYFTTADLPTKFSKGL